MNISIALSISNLLKDRLMKILRSLSRCWLIRQRRVNKLKNKKKKLKKKNQLMMVKR